MERIIADRISKDVTGNVVPEYLVKWQGLSYAEATWYSKITSFRFLLIDLTLLVSIMWGCVSVKKRKFRVFATSLHQ